MLEFHQDGKPIQLFSLYNKGKVGQMVIFGNEVDWGSSAESSPLSRYSCPSIFTIQQKTGYYYLLRDSEGRIIKVVFDTSTYYLYDAQEWLTWKSMHEKNIVSQKEEKIAHLEDHLALLKDILIKQGVRIVTKEQAKALGIKITDTLD